MNRIVAALKIWFRSVGETARASRYIAIAVVSLLIVIGGSAAQLTAQAPTTCDQGSANSPESCNVLPLDAPAPAPSSNPPLWPTDLRLVEMGRLRDAKLHRPYATQLQFPEGSSAEFAIIGRLPAGLQLDRERLVTGTPVATGNYLLDLIVPGGKNQEDVVARWRLRVVGPVVSKPKPRPRPEFSQSAYTEPAKPAPPEQPQSATQSPPTPLGQIVVYRLTSADLKLLTAEQAANAAAQAQAVAEVAKAQTAKAEERIRIQEQAQAMAKAFGQSQSPAPSPSPAPQMGTSKQSSARQESSGPASRAQQGPVAKAAAPSQSEQTVQPASLPLAKALMALSNVEFPTESLFRKAVKKQLGSVPDDLSNRIVEQARKRHNYASQASQLKWSDVGGWKAVRPLPSWGYRTIYGFMPFWWGQPAPASGGKAPADAAPIIDFSLYDRIGVVGAQLSLNKQRSWVAGDDNFDWATMSRFAWTAQSHGTKLDLVLEASNWEGLQTLPETGDAGTNPLAFQNVFDQADLAANRAADLLDIKMTDSAGYFRMALLPIWKVDSRVFSGLTVMFTPPARDDPNYRSFEEFTHRFVRTLMFRMKQINRPLALNIAVSSEFLCNPEPAGSTGSGEACNPGPYGFGNINNWLETASTGGVVKIQNSQKIASRAGGGEKANMNGRSAKDNPKKSEGYKSYPLDFNLIVFIEQPTRDARMKLRLVIDQIPSELEIKGPQKVKLLRSIIPVMFGPGDENDLMGGDTVENQLAYYDEVYGGVGFWPVTMDDTPTGRKTNAKILQEFFGGSPPQDDAKVKDSSTGTYFISMALRLILQALVVVVFVVSAYLYIWGELADEMRTKVIRLTFGLAVLTALLFGFLLVFDPALSKLSQGNRPLGVVAAIFAFTASFYIFKPKIIKP